MTSARIHPEEELGVKRVPLDGTTQESNLSRVYQIVFRDDVFWQPSNEQMAKVSSKGIHYCRVHLRQERAKRDGRPAYDCL
eukprot:CAMPEP_0195600300 /NCGR_PEP_ID=MMETSP0815-20121206/4481_1 /TAXON_ID=97485 /ORGANISM="Prymnesium parvum, Strain Texoma1" /LENGTH=80 /DNA_ID=CAMNT_0040739771 /DNA_START=112 /DNA_END=354 /DNA_ORIENTATION=+